MTQTTTSDLQEGLAEVKSEPADDDQLMDEVEEEEVDQQVESLDSQRRRQGSPVRNSHLELSPSTPEEFALQAEDDLRLVEYMQQQAAANAAASAGASNREQRPSKTAVMSAAAAITAVIGRPSLGASFTPAGDSTNRKWIPRSESGASASSTYASATEDPTQSPGPSSEAVPVLAPAPLPTLPASKLANAITPGSSAATPSQGTSSLSASGAPANLDWRQAQAMGTQVARAYEEQLFAGVSQVRVPEDDSDEEMELTPRSPAKQGPAAPEKDQNLGEEKGEMSRVADNKGENDQEEEEADGKQNFEEALFAGVSQVQIPEDDMDEDEPELEPEQQKEQQQEKEKVQEQEKEHEQEPRPAGEAEPAIAPGSELQAEADPQVGPQVISQAAPKVEPDPEVETVQEPEVELEREVEAEVESRPNRAQEQEQKQERTTALPAWSPGTAHRVPSSVVSDEELEKVTNLSDDTEVDELVDEEVVPTRPLSVASAPAKERTRLKNSTRSSAPVPRSNGQPKSQLQNGDTAPVVQSKGKEKMASGRPGTHDEVVSAPQPVSVQSQNSSRKRLLLTDDESIYASRTLELIRPRKSDSGASDQDAKKAERLLTAAGASSTVVSKHPNQSQASAPLSNGQQKSQRQAGDARPVTQESSRVRQQDKAGDSFQAADIEEPTKRPGDVVKKSTSASKKDRPEEPKVDSSSTSVAASSSALPASTTALMSEAKAGYEASKKEGKPYETEEEERKWRRHLKLLQEETETAMGIESSTDMKAIKVLDLNRRVVKHILGRLQKTEEHRALSNGGLASAPARPATQEDSRVRQQNKAGDSSQAAANEEPTARAGDVVKKPMSASKKDLQEEPKEPRASVSRARAAALDSSAPAGEEAAPTSAPSLNIKASKPRTSSKMEASQTTATPTASTSTSLRRKGEGKGAASLILDDDSEDDHLRARILRSRDKGKDAAFLAFEEDADDDDVDLSDATKPTTKHRETGQIRQEMVAAVEPSSASAAASSSALPLSTTTPRTGAGSVDKGSKKELEPYQTEKEERKARKHVELLQEKIEKASGIGSLMESKAIWERKLDRKLVEHLLARLQKTEELRTLASGGLASASVPSDRAPTPPMPSASEVTAGPSKIELKGQNLDDSDGEPQMAALPNPVVTEKQLEKGKGPPALSRLPASDSVDPIPLLGSALRTPERKGSREVVNTEATSEDKAMDEPEHQSQVERLRDAKSGPNDDSQDEVKMASVGLETPRGASQLRTSTPAKADASGQHQGGLGRLQAQAVDGEFSALRTPERQILRETKAETKGEGKGEVGETDQRQAKRPRESSSEARDEEQVEDEGWAERQHQRQAKRLKPIPGLPPARKTARRVDISTSPPPTSRRAEASTSAVRLGSGSMSPTRELVERDVRLGPARTMVQQSTTSTSISPSVRRSASGLGFGLGRDEAQPTSRLSSFRRSFSSRNLRADASTDSQRRLRLKAERSELQARVYKLALDFGFAKTSQLRPYMGTDGDLDQCRARLELHFGEIAQAFETEVFHVIQAVKESNGEIAQALQELEEEALVLQRAARRRGLVQP
ncbi:unnamed protein product [Tilletia laevis]|nr:unnamed protein product [Tilletia caries]CAD6901907.1 unnamed protein product [Tilletia laevis]CAD6907984.1 unnamed protein product [Tilletia controversa]CAD6957106.1 unnamed protein product [Tilletia caries]CAD6968105.1 unnamed protein product [Tilletia controversa]